MDGKSQYLYEAGTEPLGRSVRWRLTGGEKAALERYWCGAMQAAKRPGLAQGPHGEDTKGRKTYGKIPPCLKILHDGAAVVFRRSVGFLLNPRGSLALPDRVK
jgi:hypothetical protein